jgi:hypothetical protein
MWNCFVCCWCPHERIFYVFVCSNCCCCVQIHAHLIVEARLVPTNMIIDYSMYPTVREFPFLFCTKDSYVYWALCFIILNEVAQILWVSRNCSNFQWFSSPYSARSSSYATWPQGDTHECNTECQPILHLLWASVYSTHSWWVRVRGLID